MISTLDQAIHSATENPEAFTVSFLENWEDAGYAYKKDALEKLKECFKEAEDYTQHDRGKRPNAQNPKPEQEYRLTGECFKSLCMIANTAKGRETRLYYIKVEKEYRKILAARMFAEPDPRLVQLPDLYQQLGAMHQTIVDLTTQIAALQADRQNLRLVSSQSYAEKPDAVALVHTLEYANSIIGFAKQQSLVDVLKENFRKKVDYTRIHNGFSGYVLTEACLQELAIVCRTVKGAKFLALPELLVIDRSRLVEPSSVRKNTRLPQASSDLSSPADSDVAEKPKACREWVSRAEKAAKLEAHRLHSMKKHRR